MVSSNVEWLNSNENRKYPFAEWTVQKTSGGNILPDNFILDLRLTGTKTFQEVLGVNQAVIYYLKTLERIGTTKTRLHIVERVLPSTDQVIGYFEIPFGSQRGDKFKFVKTFTETTVSGFMILGKPTDSNWSVGSFDFVPASTEFEPRVCVPFPGKNYVNTLSKLGDTFQATGNVSLAEGANTKIGNNISGNALTLEFVEPEPLDCDEPKLCVEERICPQPALMTLQGIQGDHRYNVFIEGVNGVQASSLVELKSGGNPFNPADYGVRGVVLTYHGPITSKFVGTDPNDPDHYEYGLDCGQGREGDVQDLIDKAQELIVEVDNLLD